MTARTKDEGRVYLRRSDAKQETSLETQLTWALTEATKQGVTVEASQADLDRMLAQRMHSHRHIYLDNAITGANLERAGFQSLIRDVMSDKRVSHVLVYKRDRLGRPDDPIPMMVIEQSLTTAGVTLVFSDGVARPSQRGVTNLPPGPPHLVLTANPVSLLQTALQSQICPLPRKRITQEWRPNRGTHIFLNSCHPTAACEIAGIFG